MRQGWLPPMTTLDRMPDGWWAAYGQDVEAGVKGDACAVLVHVIEEEREIASLEADHRIFDGVAALRFGIPTGAVA